MKTDSGFETTFDVCLPALEAHALWAGTYDAGANPLLSLEERTLERLLPPLKGKRALDLACGTGRWLERLIRGGAQHALGVDLSGPMLSVAAGKPRLKGNLLRADGLALPLRNHCVDLAVCSFAAGYFPNLDALGGELARVMSHGASVFVSDFHPIGHEHGWKRSFRHAGRVVEITSLAHSIHLICNVLARHGFTLVYCLEPHIAEPERGLFARSGKLHLFESACKWPAIFILQFKWDGKRDSLEQLR